MLHTCLRRCAALVAAYAVAIHAVLSGFAGVVPHVPGAGTAFVTCRGDDPADPAQPANSDHCLCLAGHCAGGAASPERIAFGRPWRLARVTVDFSVFAPTLAPVTRRADANAARAPPRV